MAKKKKKGKGLINLLLIGLGIYLLTRKSDTKSDTGNGSSGTQTGGNTGNGNALPDTGGVNPDNYTPGELYGIRQRNKPRTRVKLIS